jgi:hypothetical protein
VNIGPAWSSPRIVPSEVSHIGGVTLSGYVPQSHRCTYSLKCKCRINFGKNAVMGRGRIT